MRYAVIGAAGQLGRDLCPRLPGEVVALGRDRADLTRPDSLRAVLSELRPDTIINCAAYNYVDRAETEPTAAFAVNAWGVRDLAAICRDLGLLLVHYSTDYVFGLDATHRSPWREEDAPGPLSVYGLSKLAGEYLVRSICPRHLVVRTCGLYGVWGSGGKGGNFVETMLRLAATGTAAAHRRRPGMHAELYGGRGRGDRGPARNGADGAVSRHERGFVFLARFRPHHLRFGEAKPEPDCDQQCGLWCSGTAAGLQRSVQRRLRESDFAAFAELEGCSGSVPPRTHEKSIDGM